MIPQAYVLARRYAALLLRDRRNLVLLLGQAPVLALAGVVLFKAGLFERPGGSPGEAAQLLFLLVLTVIWLGSIDAAREVVKERGVFEREAAVGVRLGAYLVSKAVVLFALVAAQTVLYAAVLLAFRPLHAPVDAYATVFAILLLTALVAVGMGLCVSAAVRSEDQATSIIPLILIPQLLFAGTIVPVERMGELAQTLSTLIFARWSLAGIGTAIDMNERIAEDPRLSAANSFGTEFFDLRAGTTLLILAGFLVAFLLATAWLLRRRRA